MYVIQRHLDMIRLLLRRPLPVTRGIHTMSCRNGFPIPNQLNVNATTCWTSGTWFAGREQIKRGTCIRSVSHSLHWARSGTWFTGREQFKRGTCTRSVRHSLQLGHVCVYVTLTCCGISLQVSSCSWLLSCPCTRTSQPTASWVQKTLYVVAVYKMAELRGRDTILCNSNGQSSPGSCTSVP